MQCKIGPHRLAGLIIDNAVALPVPQPELGIVVPSFRQILGLENILQYGLSENALHLALSLQSLGQILGSVSDGLGLLLEMPDCLGKLGLDGGAGLGVGLLLLLEGLRHSLDGLVKTAGDILHCLGSLLPEGLLTGLEILLIFQCQGRSGSLNGILLGFLQLCERLVVIVLQLLQGLSVALFPVLAKPFLRLCSFLGFGKGQIPLAKLLSQFLDRSPERSQLAVLLLNFKLLPPDKVPGLAGGDNPDCRYRNDDDRSDYGNGNCNIHIR